MRRSYRIALIVVLGIGLFLGLASLALMRGYNAARPVAARLEKMFGGSVEIARVRIGLRRAMVEDLKFFETPQEKHPWLSARKIAVSDPFAVMRGHLPTQLSLEGVDLYLRFDRSGNLLTKLPKVHEGGAETLPMIVASGATLTIDQEGRPPFVVHDAAITARQQDRSYVITGEMKDPEWGDWTLTASARADATAADAQITSRDVAFTQAMLSRLPFVPASVWREVQCAGHSPAELRLDFKDHALHFHVALKPTLTDLRLPLFDLQSHDARGMVQVDDEDIRLHDMRITLAGGSAVTNGSLAFQDKDWIARAEVQATGLDVQKLPKSWGLPSEIGGRLVGHATLTIRDHAGVVEPDGSGEGVIQNATVAGLPADPIVVRMHPAAKGFRLRTEKPTSLLLPRQPAPMPVLRTVAWQSAGPELVLVQAATPAKPDRFLPVRILNDVIGGTTWVLNTLIHDTSTFLGKLAATPAPGETPSYIDVNVHLHKIDVPKLIRRTRIALPFGVRGDVSVHVTVSIPLSGLRTPKLYRVEGEATSSTLTVAGTEIQDLAAHVSYREGVARLDRLTASFPGEGPNAVSGTFRGTARLPLIPRGNLALNLRFDRIALAIGLHGAPALAAQIHGAVSGSLEGTVKGGTLGNLQAWNMAVSVQSNKIAAYGARLRDFTGTLHFDNGTLHTHIARGQFEGGNLTGDLDVHAAAPYVYEARIRLDHLELADLGTLNPALRPPVALGGAFSTTAQARGTLVPFRFQATGAGQMANLKAAGATIQNLAFGWDVNENRLKVTKIDGTMYGGKLSGDATLPLQANVGGALKVAFTDVHMAGLSHDLPTLPIRLGGTTNGTVTATLSPAPAGKQRTFDIALDLHSPRLIVEGIPTVRVTATITYKAGALEYHLKGGTLGGTFALDGKVPPKTAEPAPREPEGKLRVRGVHLARLWNAYHLDDLLGPFEGIISMELDVNHLGPNRAPVGAGRISIFGLRWEEERLTRGPITVDLRLTPKGLRLENLNGEVADGSLRGRAFYGLKNSDRSFFAIEIDHANVARLLVPWPSFASRSRGTVDIRIAGHLGSLWTGQLIASMGRGRIAGFDVSDVRLPIRFWFSPQSGGAETDSYDAIMTMATGRVTGRFRYAMQAGHNLSGSARFHDVDLPTLLRHFSDVSRYGTGKLTGQLDFSGENIRSLGDLKATLDAKLSQTQAFQFPVLSELPLFLPTAGAGSSWFQRGTIRGTLQNNVFRLQRLELVGQVLQLIIHGNVTLPLGGLHLEATANTGKLLQNHVGLRLLGAQLPAEGPIPQGLLTRGTNFLSNRVAHLSITGTIRNPHIHFQPLLLISPAALQFFVSRAW